MGSPLTGIRVIAIRIPEILPPEPNGPSLFSGQDHRVLQPVLLP